MTEGHVKVGLFLTNQHPPGTDMAHKLDEQLAMLRYARDSGWDSVWAGQHYLGEDFAMLQPAPFLGRLAADAGDMTLGLGIMLLALQNPVDVAETVVSLDAVCGGRFVFGVGLGYRDVEYDAFGVDRGERLHRFTENLRITTALLRGERVSADLPWCRLDDVKLAVTSVQEPSPPLWMAANSDGAVRRAARSADTWMINPHARLETVGRQVELFGSERAAAGRSPARELPAVKEIFCGPDRATALEMARPHLENKYKVYANWGQDKVLPGKESFDIPFAELEEDRFIIGSPDECLARLLPWREQLGVDHFILRTHWSGMPLEDTLASMRLLSDEVVPELRRAVPATTDAP
ncbi:LLM class flavin-dependent oxidoreductase [Geodermatophilus sp. DF01-2]|nr:LLM class flavin-dependent oxidoreductase [Geodermatophilus sp. DF01_2]